MSERLLNRRNIVLGLIGPVMLIGLVSCGDNDDHKPKAPTEQVSEGNDDSSPEVTTKYYSNGTSTVEVSADFPTDTGTLVVRWCEGNDLVELASVDQNYEAGGGSVARSVGHSACNDGRLTESDFPPIQR